MKKNTRKVPQSVKVKRRIDAALAEQEVMHKRHIKELQRKHGEQVTQLKIENQRSKIIVHNIGALDPQELIDDLSKQTHNISPLKESGKSSGLIVANWRDSWKWWVLMHFMHHFRLNLLTLCPNILSPPSM